MNKEDIQRIIDKEKKDREMRIKRRWETLEPFETPDDVPDLPHTDPDTWRDYYVPKLIQAGAIPKKDLIVGQEYIGNHRQTTRAKWNGKEFVYTRQKFNAVFDDTCNHFEDDDGFALFVPIALAP